MPGVLEDDTSSVKDTSSVTSRFPTLAQRPSEAGKTGVCVSRRGEERGARECRPAPGRAAPPASRPVLAPHPAAPRPAAPRPAIPEPGSPAPRPAAPRPAIPVRGIMWAVGGEPREVAGFDAPVIPTPPREAFSVGNNNECRKKEKKKWKRERISQSSSIYSQPSP